MSRRLDALARFWVHTIRVEQFLRQDEDGADVYGPAVSMVAFVEETNRVVRNTDGAEVVSTAQAYIPAGTVVETDSRVTLPSGRRTQLISIERHDSAGLGLPDHVTLNLE